MNNYKKIVLLLSIGLSANLYAQQEGIQMGSFTLFPTVGLSYGHDDNVYYGRGEDKLSSNYYVFSPGIRLETEGEKTNFLAQYNYDRTVFNADSNYNFEMHHFLAGLGHNASSRTRFDLTAEYYDGTDRIGTANQQGLLLNLGLDPDEWHSFGVGGKWHYGGVGAKGSIDVELGMIDREYDNNREYTATRDRETRYLGATYTHQISPKTNYLLQAKYADIDYDIATLDNEETRLMLGAEWNVTGKTTARALVGYLSKDFKEPAHNDFSGVAVEAGVTWSPRSYSVFDLTLARETDETNGNGSYVLRNSADLGWTHYWVDRFSTTANIGYSDEKYKGSLRDDSLNYYGLSAKYQFSDWLMSGLGYRHSDRSSSLEDFEYKDNSILFTLELSK
ncbi:MAG TPA: outer membrane beta-barrel protein [Gammaproteobacteria bacterium]|nr:outer membrane beta-barrel protein [Xanthomonadales bacterium]MCB1595553.1 outer membrane beta-barrel protein [Xanthomonadales bacterium]HOP23050.1 outer membrane beta-barrel protein [Gammaproteobacteria bacterium]HPI95575.1 outer membrane beta-barrel protein [Gammaproteobacteria bacterium]HPQ86734.1 outer membrane beta-barrel protein [Gammaproteobacteria bacterium]